MARSDRASASLQKHPGDARLKCSDGSAAEFLSERAIQCKSVRFRLREASVVLRLYALIAALAAMSTSECGTAHATLDFITPPTGTAGHSVQRDCQRPIPGKA